MKDSLEMETCDGCGQQKPLTEFSCNELCDDCKNIAEILQKDTQKVAKIMKLIRFTCTEDGIDCCNGKYTEEEGGLPEVLDAMRFRTKDCDANSWYVSISEIEGKPVEIFASTAFDRDRHLQSRISNLTTITRLISLILRHIFLGEVLTLNKTIKQIHRSSRQKNDLPDMLTKVLKKYPRDKNKTT